MAGSAALGRTADCTVSVCSVARSTAAVLSLGADGDRPCVTGATPPVAPPGDAWGRDGTAWLEGRLSISADARGPRLPLLPPPRTLNMLVNVLLLLAVDGMPLALLPMAARCGVLERPRFALGALEPPLLALLAPRYAAAAAATLALLPADVVARPVPPLQLPLPAPMPARWCCSACS